MDSHAFLMCKWTSVSKIPFAGDFLFSAQAEFPETDRRFDDPEDDPDCGSPFPVDAFPFFACQLVSHRDEARVDDGSCFPFAF